MEEFYKIYGIRNCEQNEKLLEILDEAEVEYEFFDFRDYPPSEEQLEQWGEFEGEEYPINYRSSLFKKNKKKFDKLSDQQKVVWLQQHYHCLLRPVIIQESEDSQEILAVGGRPERLAQKAFKLIKGF
ncbi:ArsC/Spx/MgsR family protein [Bacteriovorax sp. DB6_IX]|uniref:ArsC/Spx/MgsR family protein n=1 Tax=Bacteriovorax sp. DB6_IX TaxID=1353530 RepID=UPI00038A1B3A|nr:ArsC/Spx/MgsR family protein [Bacteriovorax sp. DB6_IX]EQC50516.1 ArsC family protein [Bacteriovorax sp. DB6_IX]